MKGRSMMRIWPFKWVLTVVAILALIVWWRFPQKETTSALQSQTAVKRGDVLQRVLISGAIAAKRTTGIAPPYEGYVKHLYVDVGDDVKIGQPLVTISQLAHSKNEELYPILAPFSGKVVQVQKTEGEYLDKFGTGQGKSAILRIDDLSELFVQADVPEIDLGKLKIGQAAVIRATAVTGRTYKGEIISISRAPKGGDGWDRNRIEYPVRMRITDPDAQLVSGMSASAEVITKEVRNVLVLRHEFIVKEKDAYFVNGKDGKRMEIKIGLENEDQVEVTSGLAEGGEVRPVDFLNL